MLEQLPGRKWLANGYYRRDTHLHATVYTPYQGEVTVLKRHIAHYAHKNFRQLKFFFVNLQSYTILNLYDDH